MLRLVGVWQRNDSDFAAELESHLEMEIEDGVRRGLSEQEARRQALVRHGGVAQAQQAYRERRGLPWLEQLVQDVLYGARTLRRSPGFTVVAVATLALGIATTTTVFRWMDGVVLHPLAGVSEPQRIVALDSLTANGEVVPNSYPDYIDFRDRLKLLDGIAVYRPHAFSVGPRGRTERLGGEFVSGNFFAVLGVKPEVGQLFSPAQYGDTPNGYPAVVLSDRYWRSHYGGDPSIVGRTIRVDEHELTVMGVADPAFQGSMTAMAFDIWVPYLERPMLEGVPAWMMRDRQDRAVIGIARLKPGVSMAMAQQELATLAARMAKADADTNAGMSARLIPMADSPFGAQGLLAAPLRMLMGICLLVLAIVCVNVANLLLARATARQREYGTRLALGAGRWRLARQVLTECLMLTLSAAVLGLVATRWTVKLLAVLLPAGQMNLALPQGGEVRTALFTVSICLLATAAAGAAPALLLAMKPPAMPMSEGGRGGMAGRGGRHLGHHQRRAQA
ncbi:ABC transporter permease, partial [Silvibacterium sp.]|uniref:ABC transporter permease n=1 Tax=Silvibacterium sp. TaxID=1964179 RepID=UPI0039E3B4BB